MSPRRPTGSGVLGQAGITFTSGPRQESDWQFYAVSIPLIAALSALLHWLFP